MDRIQTTNVKKFLSPPVTIYKLVLKRIACKVTSRREREALSTVGGNSCLQSVNDELGRWLLAELNPTVANGMNHPLAWLSLIQRAGTFWTAQKWATGKTHIYCFSAPFFDRKMTCHKNFHVKIEFRPKLKSTTRFLRLFFLTQALNNELWLSFGDSSVRIIHN